jgi:hypothetical protein
LSIGLDDQDDSPFFVDLKGKPLHLRNYNKLKIVKEMCEEMGIDRLYIMDGRRGMASKQRELKCAGNTGCDNSVEVQDKVYNNLKQQEGWFNKLLANKAMLQKKANEDVTGEDDLRAILDQKIRKDTAQMKESVLALEEQNMWNKFAHGVKGRTLRHRILSAEKVRMLRAIYSWSCIEYSALLLCNKFPPKKKHVPFYIRFLCTDAPGMVDVR